MFLAGIVLMCKNPDLLKKRLNAKGTEGEQSLVIDTKLYDIVRHPMYSGDDHLVPLYAAGAWLFDFLCYFSHISRYYFQEDLK